MGGIAARIQTVRNDVKNHGHEVGRLLGEVSSRIGLKESVFRGHDVWPESPTANEW